MDVTRDDLRELKDDLGDQIRSGFERQDRSLEAINQHLRTLNGKVAEHAALLVGHDVRLTGHDREFRDIKTPTSEDRGEERILRAWHLWAAIAIVVGTIAVVEFFGRLQR